MLREPNWLFIWRNRALINVDQSGGPKEHANELLAVPLLHSIWRLRLLFYPLRYFGFLLQAQVFLADFSTPSNDEVLSVLAYSNISNDGFLSKNYIFFRFENFTRMP